MLPRPSTVAPRTAALMAPWPRAAAMTDVRRPKYVVRPSTAPPATALAHFPWPVVSYWLLALRAVLPTLVVRPAALAWSVAVPSVTPPMVSVAPAGTAAAARMGAATAATMPT